MEIYVTMHHYPKIYSWPSPHTKSVANNKKTTAKFMQLIMQFEWHHLLYTFQTMQHCLVAEQMVKLKSKKLARFNKGERETPLEIVETEHQVAQFLKKGVSMITREGRFITMTIMMTAMVMVIS